MSKPIEQRLQPSRQQPLYLFVASTFWSRWRGWKALPKNQSCLTALWLRPCRAVHLWGMRHALDICFLDENDQPLMFCPAVPAGAVRWHRMARSVLEAPIGYLSGPEQFTPWATALQQLRQTGGGLWTIEARQTSCVSRAESPNTLR